MNTNKTILNEVQGHVQFVRILTTNSITKSLQNRAHLLACEKTISEPNPARRTIKDITPFVQQAAVQFSGEIPRAQLSITPLITARECLKLCFARLFK